MSDIQRYEPWPQEWPMEDANGDLVTYEDHRKVVEAVEAERDALRAKVARLEGAIDYILDGMAISAPEYAIDPDDDFLDAANADWVRDTVSRLAAALADGGK